MIIEGKSYTFENPKTTFITNKKLSCNECRKCKKVYMGLMQALDNKISLDRNNIKLSENYV